MVVDVHFKDEDMQITISVLYNGFQLSVESNFAFALVLHYYALRDWLTKLAPPSQPIRIQIKTNRIFAALVFPRLAPVTCICFEF